MGLQRLTLVLVKRVELHEALGQLGPVRITSIYCYCRHYLNLTLPTQVGNEQALVLVQGVELREALGQLGPVRMKATIVICSSCANKCASPPPLLFSVTAHYVQTSNKAQQQKRSY